MSAQVPNRLSLRLAWRAITHSFHFQGRSTRSELMSFYIVGVIANCVSISWSDTGSPPAIFPAIGLAWSILWQWPFVPLFVRRLHDQDRSGWWASIMGLQILAMLVLYSLPEDMNALHSIVSVSFADGPRHFVPSTLMAWLWWGVLLVTSIAVIIMNLLSGTMGANRYGDDPRLPVPNEALSPAL
jgi:uncharacterized membrane protein YhaH (DUF805 family)